MSKRAKEFYPGWKMTVEQHGRYWRDVSAVAHRLKVKSEEARQLIHERAFGGPKSAKEINHLKDFDEFIAAVKALLQPANLDAQMRQAEMPKTRLLHAIQKLSPEAYYRAEASRKFGTDELEQLDESQLTMLRNHLAKRAAAIRWPRQSLRTANLPEQQAVLADGGEEEGDPF